MPSAFISGRVKEVWALERRYTFFPAASKPFNSSSAPGNNRSFSMVMARKATMESFTAKDVFDLFKAGDKTADAILQIVYSYLGQLIANVCNVLNPEIVIIGGGVSKAGQCIIDGVIPYFMKDAFVGVKQVAFALAELGNDAGAYGAFKLVL